MQQSVRIESETDRTGDIFACFVLAALLLVQIKYNTMTAVRGTDILLDAFVRMICRVRVEFAEIQAFQVLKHLVKALFGQPVE